MGKGDNRKTRKMRQRVSRAKFKARVAAKVPTAPATKKKKPAEKKA